MPDTTADVAGRTLRPNLRCTCHHSGRHCGYQCPDTARAVRQSDGRPVCKHCVDCDTAFSVGFSVHSYYWKDSIS